MVYACLSAHNFTLAKDSLVSGVGGKATPPGSSCLATSSAAGLMRGLDRQPAFKVLIVVSLT